ncbi:MAG: hypothetical protein IJ113_05760 [Eggerthellaceae bacterium]|nr:hypothetical protein [Eggerthellaceae bacterium]
MNISYSDKLMAYLQKKGISNLQISVVETAVEAGPPELLIEPITEQQIDDLKNEKYRYIHTIPGGELENIFVTTRGLEFDDEIFFDLKSFFGIKDITVKGIHAFKLR